jgi:tetratricopeptide (TPR) repeat protein
MAGWIARTLTRLAGSPAPAAAKALTEGELRQALESAKGIMNRGDFPTARSALRALVTSNPHDADTLAHYGAAAYLLGDPADARSALSRAVQIDSNSIVGQKFLAAACDALGDLQQLDAAAKNALRLAPSDPDVLNLYGISCINRFQIEEAANCFNAALEIAPNNIGALMNLELLSVRSTRDRRTLERGPNVALARSDAIERLRAQYQQGQLDDLGLKYLLMLLSGARETFGEAVELARTIASRSRVSRQLADQLAVISMWTGELSQVLRFRRIVAEQDPALPMVRSNLAYSQLNAGYDGWFDNWTAMRLDECNANLGAYAREVSPWTGQRIGSGKVLVYQEQGIGDAILALRLIPMLAQRGIRFDLWVNPALAGLASSVKGYENLIRSNARPDARTLGCDYASTLFGLISALGADHAELIAHPTVLAASPDRLAQVRARLRALPGRRIGLAYGGNPDRRDDWVRAIPPSALQPLAALDGTSWVSLVVDKRPDLAEVVRMFRMDDPMREVKDFEDTAAIVSELDAVIAIDSSVAHLACSLGKPVWVLVPPMLDWRWQIGDDTHPWWPTATLLRSPEIGQWNRVIEELACQVPAWRG